MTGAVAVLGTTMLSGRGVGMVRGVARDAGAFVAPPRVAEFVLASASLPNCRRTASARLVSTGIAGGGGGACARKPKEMVKKAPTSRPREVREVSLEVSLEPRACSLMFCSKHCREQVKARRGRFMVTFAC